MPLRSSNRKPKQPKPKKLIKLVIITQTLASVVGAHVMLGVNILLWVWGEWYQAHKVGISDVRGDRGPSYSIFWIVKSPACHWMMWTTHKFLVICLNSKETFFKSNLGFWTQWRHVTQTTEQTGICWVPGSPCRSAPWEKQVPRSLIETRLPPFPRQIRSSCLGRLHISWWCFCFFGQWEFFFFSEKYIINNPLDKNAGNLCFHVHAFSWFLVNQALGAEFHVQEGWS